MFCYIFFVSHVTTSLTLKHVFCHQYQRNTINVYRSCCVYRNARWTSVGDGVYESSICLSVFRHADYVHQAFLSPLCYIITYYQIISHHIICVYTEAWIEISADRRRLARCKLPDQWYTSVVGSLLHRATTTTTTTTTVMYICSGFITVSAHKTRPSVIAITLLVNQSINQSVVCVNQTTCIHTQWKYIQHSKNTVKLG